MKTRNGFVSNSSSSSFICVGFPASQVVQEINPEIRVREKVSLRKIDEIAGEYFDTDESYKSYRDGFTDTCFWKYAYKRIFGVENESPFGFYPTTVNDDEYYIRQIGPSTEYGAVEIDMNDVVAAMEEVKKRFPTVTPKTFVCHSE